MSGSSGGKRGEGYPEAIRRSRFPAPGIDRSRRAACGKGGDRLLGVGTAALENDRADRVDMWFQRERAVSLHVVVCSIHRQRSRRELTKDRIAKGSAVAPGSWASKNRHRAMRREYLACLYDGGLIERVRFCSSRTRNSTKTGRARRLFGPARPAH